VSAATEASVVRLHDVSKTFGTGAATVHALRSVSLDVAAGDFVAIVGPSGSGKSTMMNVIGLLDDPTSGSYALDGIDTAELDESEQAELRSTRIGFVFQSFNLIRRSTALAQVELPLVYNRTRRSERRARAAHALAAVGLADRMDHKPTQLSGGQQQRVAIARAIVTEPALILADEPTGALDTHSTADVLAIFRRLNEEGRTIVVITHDHEVAEFAKRVVTVRDGEIVSDRRAA
jgi:putative ABC transport system ATP-binding protein